MRTTTTENLQQINLKCLLYGQPGAGKTYTALTLDPKRTLIVSAESGLLPLRGKPYKVHEVETWDDLMTIWRELQSPEAQKAYDNVFIDSLTEIGEICKIHIVTKERPAVRGKVDKIYDEQMDLKDWSLYTDKMKRFVRSYRDLPYNIFFTAMEKDEKDELTGAITVAPAVAAKGFASAIPGFFDEVFRIVIKKAEDSQERYFLTELTEKSVAKDRSGKLDHLETPDWSAIMAKIQAGFQKKEKVT